MRIIFLLVLVLLVAARAESQTSAGVGARAEGMGSAFVAVADDSSAVYWNPAGIATGALFDLQIARASEGPGTFVGLSLPVLAFSYYRTSHPAVSAGGFPTVRASPDRQDEGLEGVPTSVLTATHVGITVVQTIVPSIVIGTTARLVRARIGSLEARTTADLDVGAMVTAGSLRFGLTGRNLREPEFEGPDGPIAVQRQFRAGAAFAPRSSPAGVHGPFTLAFDADLTRADGPARETRMAAAGGEYWLPRGIAGIRAGWRWNTLDRAARAWSGGATVRLPRSLHVDGQITRARATHESEWTLAARVTF